MIEIQYKVVARVENSEVASFLEDIEKDDTKELIRTQAVKEEVIEELIE